ncbi:D-xylose transporter XylE [Bacteroides oleiciplenus]|uniref:Sugar porter (SP) family MFS transporter n=2 Tax=Bacteroides oleiciplenus TaxID=626931 RepID=K9E7K7_9BACE|nr:D-xylose transporter XylE [Bacteroides oleiciplenus]EKU92658.1 sugar porter (SP) family MFS transporter [Bacteroides oleiciplenus YIT 12058]RGN37236.1 D-xylose transporter XylE [Bacteroides oleiciplenus]
MNDANNGSKLYLYSITTVAILGGLLFGYDTAVISGAEKGLEAFFLQATDFQYDKVMHGITSSSALIGCVLGGALSGIFASRLGRRNSLRLASVLFFLSALGSYYPEFLFFNYGEPNMELLIAFNLYRVLGGIGVGLASAVCPMYIAEIAPSNIRGTLVSCNQFAIIFGMLVVYFVNFLIMGGHTNPIIDKSVDGILSVNPASDMWSVQTGWRYMFGSEAFPAALFGFLLFFVPKTPRYLVLVHQDEKAYSILEKVNGASKAKEILAEIKATSKEKTEKLFSYGVAVIVIGILLSVFQQAIGINAVLYYAPRIFENAGAEGGGMMQTVIMGIVNIVFTLVAIFTVDRFGRKPLLIVGSIGMAIGAFAVAMCDSMGIKGIVPVVSVIVYAAFFMMSWGPICWVLISEIFPNTIRGKAVAIAVAFQWIFNYIISSTFPALYDFSPMFAYSLYGIICVAAAIFVWRWVPETKGKTLEDMSKLWKKNK